MSAETQRYLVKAESALVVAEELLASGHLPDAASKVYYAMFYATGSNLLSPKLPLKLGLKLSKSR